METFNVKGGVLEVWKDIQGYEGIYQVSTHGKVRSLSRQLHNKSGYFTSKEKMLKSRLSGRDEKNKYLEVALYKNHKRQDVRVHRLVAKAFIPNPNSYPIINHKDGNKKNNNVNNLEWCTHKQNRQHAINNGLVKFYYGKQNKKSRKIMQCDIDGNCIKVWFGVREIAKETGFNYGNIDRCLRGKRPTAYGYIWRVADGKL